MKNLKTLAAALLGLAVVGCNAGGETGDPNVGANPAPPASSAGQRPGTPGGPPATTPQRDPSGGRPGMSTGG